MCAVKVVGRCKEGREGRRKMVGKWRVWGSVDAE